MMRFHRQIRRILPYTILDIWIVIVAYMVVLVVRTFVSLEDLIYGSSFILFSILLLWCSFYINGVYHRLWGKTSGHGITILIRAVLPVTLIQLIADLFIAPRPLPLSVILVGNALALGGFILIRYRSRLISGFSWRWEAIWHHKFPRTKTRALIIGAGEAGQTLALKLKHRVKDGGYEVVGFVDDDPAKQGLYVENCPVLGTTKDIVAVAEKQRVDLIIVAIHNVPGPIFREILQSCEETTARIKVIPDMLGSMDDICQQPLLRDVEPQDLIGRRARVRHEAIDTEPIARKRILVTGAAGSIGSELCHQLLDYEPQQLLLLDNNESALYELCLDLQQKHPSCEVVPFLADITRAEPLKVAFREYRPQVVFHSAAYKHVPMLELYPGEALRVNVGGTLKLAEVARQHAVERFVLISTDKAVQPFSVMGASKRICELIIHAYARKTPAKTRFTAVRFGNVLGSRGSVLPIFMRQINNGGPITVTDRKMTRYFMSLEEAANLVLHAACLTENDDLFILQMGEVVRIVDLAERMIRLYGLRPYEDIEIQFTAPRPGERLCEQLFDPGEVVGETVHPHIMRIAQWDAAFQTEVFFARMGALLESGFRAGEDEVTQLLDLLRFPISQEQEKAVVEVSA